MDTLKKPEMLLGLANTTGLIALWVTQSRNITTLTERVTQLEKITSEIIQEVKKLAQNSGTVVGQLQSLSHAVKETKNDLKTLNIEQDDLRDTLTGSGSRPFRKPKALETPRLRPRRRDENDVENVPTPNDLSEEANLSHAEAIRRHRLGLQ